jgi:hypothetical protein
MPNGTPGTGKGKELEEDKIVSSKPLEKGKQTPPATNE